MPIGVGVGVVVSGTGSVAVGVAVLLGVAVPVAVAVGVRVGSAGWQSRRGKIKPFVGSVTWIDDVFKRVSI